jgi:hypothetical protein
MSRGVFLLGVGIAVVALAFVVTDWMIGPTPGVTEANARRIKPGMTMSQVEAILGGPGGWYSSYSNGREYNSIYRWNGPGVAVEVDFACQFPSGQFPFGRPEVVAAVCFQRTAGPTPLARLRSWLGL